MDVHIGKLCFTTYPRIVLQFPQSDVSASYIAYGDRNYLYETLGWVPNSEYDVTTRPWYTAPNSTGQQSVITYADANSGVYFLCKSEQIETAQSLTEIVEGINESSSIISEIYTMEQNESISELNVGMQQVAQVVQVNSSTAQESAASAQEMSTQSYILSDIVAKFKLRDRKVTENTSLPQ